MQGPSGPLVTICARAPEPRRDRWRSPLRSPAFEPFKTPGKTAYKGLKFRPSEAPSMNAPIAIPSATSPVPPYKHTPLFPLGPDTTPYRKVTTEGVRVEKVLGRDMLVVSREALKALSEAAFGDINHYLRPGHLQQLRNILDDCRGQPERQVRRLRLPEERQHRRRRRAADVPGHRHRDHHGQEGLQRPRRRRRRGCALAKARATPICAATCAIRRSRRCRCTKRRTPPTTCRRSARSMPRATTPTSSCSWPRAAAPPTRASCSRRRRRC